VAKRSSGGNSQAEGETSMVETTTGRGNECPVTEDSCIWTIARSCNVEQVAVSNQITAVTVQKKTVQIKRRFAIKSHHP